MREIYLKSDTDIPDDGNNSCGRRTAMWTEIIEDSGDESIEWREGGGEITHNLY